MTNRSLVLCRYNEDIGWIDSLPSDLQVFIYDKSPIPSTKPFCISTENVGRECSSYLQHIVDHYYNLTDQIYFSQAYPFPHIPDYLDILRQQLSQEKIENGFKWVGPRISNDLANKPNWGKEFTVMPNQHPNPYKRSIKSIWESIFETPCPVMPEYNVSGNFFVEKENILQHKIEKYQKLLEIVSYPEQKNFDGFFRSNCIECHFLERMWGDIFGGL
jgi:hypothetical protein